jgi:protein-disulfide isomerase
MRAHHTRRWSFAPLGVICVLLLAAGCAEQGPTGAGEPAAAPGERIAEVNGHVIELEEVDERIKQILFDEEFGAGRSSKLYEARVETIGELIDEQLVQEAAGAAGQPPEQWLEQQVAALPPVADADVAAFFETNKARFGEGVALEDVGSRIRSYLEHQRQQQVMEGLREQASIEVALGRARQDVAPAGYSVGPEDAPVVMVGFSDYQCPYCARVEPTVKQLIERYPDTLRVVYRHHPLPFHAEALLAAQAALCAGAQDGFWAYHDRLFANQQALERPQLLSYAQEQQIDLVKFEACLEAPETAAVIEADIQDAAALGASGTPTFFINGIMLTGARPIEDFESVIDEELQRTQ